MYWLPWNGAFAQKPPWRLGEPRTTPLPSSLTLLPYAGEGDLNSGDTPDPGTGLRPFAFPISGKAEGKVT